MIWVASGSVGLVLIVLVVLSLVHLARHSEAMTTGQKVGWAALIVLLPFVGLTGYFFWQLEHSDAMQPAMSSRRQDQPAPFLDDPGFHDK